MTLPTILLLAGLSLSHTLAQTCSRLSAKVPAPSVLPGYAVQLVANNITTPRDITVDTAGRLLVVSGSVGIEALTFSGNDSCITLTSRVRIVNDTSLNHGIALSADGATLYASNPDVVYAYPYDATTGTAGANVTIVNNMSNTDHVSRTLLLSKKAPGTLVISRGSTSNIDPEASDITSGHSQIKSFNLLNRTRIYDFVNDGLLLGWGLRNDVGVDEHPSTGGIYSVENSADDITRDGVDVHLNNPAEELNYLGSLLANTSPNQGRNFGYPSCFSAWNVSELNDNSNITVGSQFSNGTQSATANDVICRDDFVAPRLVFQAHMAPLDIKFNTAGSEAWITFHGSWDRQPPIGYKISTVKFANGEPVDPVTSLTALTDIVTNTNLTACPNGCFRPVGLAWDAQGRLFFSSDTTGEIYVLTTTSSTNNTAGSTPGAAASSSTTSSIRASATSTAVGGASATTSSATTASPSATHTNGASTGMLQMFTVQAWMVILALAFLVL